MTKHFRSNILVKTNALLEVVHKDFDIEFDYQGNSKQFRALIPLLEDKYHWIDD